MGKKIEKIRQGLRICVVTGIPPVNILVHRFVQVLEPTVDELVLITGNYPEKDVFSSKIRLINIANDNKEQSFFISMLKFILLQLKFTWHLVKNMFQTKITVFFLEGRMFLFPILAARLTGKKPIIIVTHSSLQIAKKSNKNGLLLLIMFILEAINNKLAHKIIVYSPSMCRLFDLEKHNKKVIIAHEHFINFNLFKIQNSLEKRENKIGYIGRFSAEKGILNFIKAAVLLNNPKNKYCFLVIGEGELKEEVTKVIQQKNLDEKIKLSGWVLPDSIPEYLNKMKLLVIASYTEGLVNVMLEAMACGTPVLATPVGAIPDVIKDGETGFVVEDNSPETIARGIIRALNHPQMEQIAANARTFVEREYTFEAAVERYRKIFAEVLKRKEFKCTVFK